MTEDSLDQLLHSKVENLRRKVLDLSRRNPLINTSLDRGRYLRVIDEFPDELYLRLLQQECFDLQPLPPFEATPADELTNEFKHAFYVALRSDEQYAIELDAVDEAADDAPDQRLAAERRLRDRVRTRLGLAPRQTDRNPSLEQHARNHHLEPGYELPKPGDVEREARHTDNLIQTLLLPDALDRAANKVRQSASSFSQETGLEVLFGAFGFLEWRTDGEEQSCVSPLVLCPLSIERTRTPEGPVYSVKGEGEQGIGNVALAEKLRSELGLALPTYDGSSVEDYLAEVEALSPPGMVWRIRRYVAIGVYPSTRLAMYADLDPTQEGTSFNEVSRSILGAEASTAGAHDYSEVYEADAPEIAQDVPPVVMDIDSSQFSVLVDLMRGRNLSVEGPPGTGKSQTIVNAIAAALAKGKKVLFVAEKLAALDVVRARLEAIGLGEFLLPLQARQGSREKVIRSLQERLSLERTSRSDFKRHHAQYRRSRDRLNGFAELLRTPFGDTGYTVQEALAGGAAAEDTLGPLPISFRRLDWAQATRFSRDEVRALGDTASALASASEVASRAAPYWKGVRGDAVAAVTATRYLGLAENAHTAFLALANLCDVLEEANVPPTLAVEQGEQLLSILRVSLQHGEAVDASGLTPAVGAAEFQAASEFAARLTRYRKGLAHVSSKLRVSIDDAAASELQQLADACKKWEWERAERAYLAEEQARRDAELSVGERTLAQFELLARHLPEVLTVDFPTLIASRALLSDTSDSVLELRSGERESERVRYLFRTARDSANEIRRRQQALARDFRMQRLPPAQELLDASETLRAGGLLSGFSKTFKAARKLWCSVLTEKRSFRKDEAAEDLLALGEWKLSQENFEQDQTLASLTGIRFKGWETDFDDFFRLFDFYDALERELAGLERRGWREALKTTDRSLIREIPALEGIPASSLDELKALVESLRETHAEHRTAVSSTGPLAERLLTATDLPASTLNSLAGDVRHTLDTRTALNDGPGPLTAQALGAAFNGAESAPQQLEAQLELLSQFCAADETVRATFLAIEEAGCHERSVDAVTRFLEHMATAQGHVTVLAETGMPAHTLAKGDPVSVAATFEAAAADVQGIAVHAERSRLEAALDDADLGWVVPAFEGATGSLSELPEAIIALMRWAIAVQTYEAHGDTLHQFGPGELDQLRGRFAAEDITQMKWARVALREQLVRTARPLAGISHGRKSQYTEMGLIYNEVSKVQRWVSVRNLVSRAGKSLQELKPVWMMSPLAVAQFIPRDSVGFDICIVDEASQMPPEDALGALMRADQAMVVGDTNQLPPSNFFQKQIDTSDDDEDELVIEESVLELANAVFRPPRRLLWHYRSRHSGLIAFSNRHIYSDELILFPSASEARADMGVTLVDVQGEYQSGLNPIEAQLVVDAIIQFMHQDADRSLGVVTLNQKQRDLIDEELQYRLDHDATAAAYVDRWETEGGGLDAFFVKNLENVQGDERDVMFISTVYGPPQRGQRVAQRFGPVNGVAGQRRLNVLFSRARERIVTFSSMRPGDILAEPDGNKGAYMLRRWLEYAATGHLDAGEITNRSFDSPLEEYVAAQIEAMGCEVEPQVGVAGYFVDLGVKHQSWPYGFILGVECDGATYHSAKSSRDRDRLRQGILEGLGWRIHRVWSTDWFNDPRGEAEKIRSAVHERLVELESRREEFRQRPELQTAQDHLDDLDEPASTSPSPADCDDPSPQVSLAIDDREAIEATSSAESEARVSDERTAEIGDRIRVWYLDGHQERLEFELCDSDANPAEGRVHVNTPLGRALLGVEEGDEVEVLLGSRIRRAVVETVMPSDAV